MKKLTLVSGASPRRGGQKRSAAAVALAVVMVLMLYALGHWALTENDPVVRGVAALAFLACTAATIVPVAIGLRKWFRSAR